MSKEHILRNLHSLIRNSALNYMNEFIWQDVELTNEFKKTYADYLEKNNYSVEFLGATAVITSSSTKYIYVPNQWFVIASYAVEVYEELLKYKAFFKKIADVLNRRPDEYARVLRDVPGVEEKTAFCECAQRVFRDERTDSNEINEATSRLWRFVSDYAWWSGQKTIDRGDFYCSVILNMLNLVNASQGFVAEIVCAYANDDRLNRLVGSIDSFTVNMLDIKEDQRDLLLPEDDLSLDSVLSDNIVSETIPKPDRVRIKIEGKSSLKEIRYKD